MKIIIYTVVFLITNIYITRLGAERWEQFAFSVIIAQLALIEYNTNKK